MRNFLPVTLVLSRSSAFVPSVSRTTARALQRAMCSAASNDRLFREELNILYDSKCNVCKLEIDFLRRRDQRLNGSGSRLKFTDLESNDYDDQDPANGRIDYETGMQAMHGITPDGKVVIGVPVFQLAYQQVGLGWLLAVTEVPGLKWIFDRGYDIFAAYRTRVTRGQTVPALVEAYREKQQLLKEQSECETCNEKASTKTVS